MSVIICSIMSYVNTIILAGFMKLSVLPVLIDDFYHKNFLKALFAVINRLSTKHISLFSAISLIRKSLK
jgi:hypothetical protein